DVLRERPEIIIEVKSIVADAGQQQGISLQADALTDQQLYAQIESNRELRASITEFLRARGYINEEQSEISKEDSGLSEKALDEENTGDTQGTADSYAPDLTRLNGRGARPPAYTARPNDSDSNRRETRNVTDEPQALRRPTPYNLLSLRDLY